MTTARNPEAGASASPGPARPNRGIPPARLMSIVFAALMIASIALGLEMSVSGLEDSASRRLGRMRLVETVSGPRAVAEISLLHGAGAQLTDGYVAHYQGAAGKAVLYVGRTASEQEAAILMEQLEDRIAAGIDRFSEPEHRVVEGVRVLSVLSDGEPQYLWQARSLVVWLGLEQDYPAGLAAAVNALH
jgi:hypothetical protein